MRWVTFDCYGTLADWRGGMAAALRPLTGDATDRLMAAYYDEELEVERENPGMRYREVLAEGLSRAAASERIALPPGGEHAFGERWAEMPIFDDVGPALSALRDDGWSLAILTNCDDDLIAQTVALMPVTFDEIVTAEQVGSYKPAHGHWRRFAELTEGRRDAWVHAANSWYIDIQPASELGIPRVWVDRDRSGHDATIADAVIPDLKGLPRAVSAIQRR
jgi:2-haloacid dehalogenase